MKRIAWFAAFAAFAAGAAFPQQHACGMLLDFQAIPAKGWKIALSAVYDNPQDAAYHMVKRIETKNVPWAIWPLDASGLRPQDTPTEYDRFVLGVRIMFPWDPIDGYATLTPVTGFAEAGLGDGRVAVKGPITRIRLRAYGFHLPFGLSLFLKDGEGKVEEFAFVQDLSYGGWRELYWQPPQAAAAKEETATAWTFDSIRFTRKGETGGGDFIVYLKDLYVEY
jgi:hypothetical protein